MFRFSSQSSGPSLLGWCWNHLREHFLRRGCAHCKTSIRGLLDATKDFSGLQKSMPSRLEVYAYQLLDDRSYFTGYDHLKDSGHVYMAAVKVACWGSRYTAGVHHLECRQCRLPRSVWGQRCVLCIGTTPRLILHANWRFLADQRCVEGGGFGCWKYAFPVMCTMVVGVKRSKNEQKRQESDVLLRNSLRSEWWSYSTTVHWLIRTWIAIERLRGGTEKEWYQ